MTSISKNKNEQIILETLKIANSALKLKNLKLNSLLEITNAINNNFSREQLLKIFEFVLRNQLNIGRLLFYTKDDDWECSIAHGLIPNVGLPTIETDLIEIREVQEGKKNGEKYFEQFDVIIPINATIHASANDTYGLVCLCLALALPRPAHHGPAQYRQASAAKAHC